MRALRWGVSLAGESEEGQAWGGRKSDRCGKVGGRKSWIYKWFNLRPPTLNLRGTTGRRNEGVRRGGWSGGESGLVFISGLTI